MTRRTARLGALLLFVLASLLTVPAGSAQTGAPRPAKSFLWKVHAKAGSGVVYLAGSVHALTADVYPLNPVFDRAFESAGTLIEEIDLREVSSLGPAAAMLSRAMYTDGRTLQDVVSKETFALVSSRLEDTGLPAALFLRMKPWMVALTLTVIEMQKAGLDPNLGLDKHFFDKATGAGKPVKGLETVESQLDRLDKMPPALQEQMLRSTLKDLEIHRKNIKTLIDAWRRGDAASLEGILLAGFKDYPEAYRSLITERNQNWLPHIEACFAQSPPCFVVVGAAHLVGSDGLIAMLERKGHRVEQQ